MSKPSEAKRPFYVVVCDGEPGFKLNKYYYSDTSAIIHALMAPGTGTCKAAQVIRCTSGDAARTATYGRERQRHEVLILDVPEPLERPLSRKR